MLPSISREQMIEVDRIMVEDLEIGVELMMEHAGLNLARLTYQIFSTGNYSSVVIIAGSGNNGGGGLVAARRLTNWVPEVIVWLPKGNPKRDVPKAQWQRAKNLEISFTSQKPKVENPLVVDAFIGYNFRGGIRESDKHVFAYLRTHDVVALDIPSGIDSNDGTNPGNVQPLSTVTLAWVKDGMKRLTQQDLGDIHLVDIGIPKSVFIDSIFGENNSTISLFVDQVYQKFAERSTIPIIVSTEGWSL